MLPRSVRWSRLVRFLMFRKRFVFSLLFINLIFFITMYVLAVTSEDADLHGDTRSDVLRDVRAAEIKRPEKMIYPDSDRDDLQELHVNRVIDHHQAKCESLVRPPRQLKERFSWYMVSPGTFVFSAYFDNRTRLDSVAIWGTSGGPVEYEHMRPTLHRRQYCQVWYLDTPQPVVLTAEYEIVPETHGLRYAPAMFICAVTRPDPPYAVSLVTAKCDTPSHVLRVHAPSVSEPRYQFTVCVSPLNMHYDDIYSFTENVEINRILGADKIVFYNHTTGGRIDRYLKHYVREGVVDVIPWQLPVAVHPDPPDPRVTPEIHYFGQVVALNECLYRYMYKSKYILFTDLDEVLVPRQHSTWRELMKLLDKERKPSFEENDGQSYYAQRAKGAFLIPNVFFRIDWPDEGTNNTIDQRFKLRTQLKLRREQRIWPFYERTKYIVLPKTVQQLGIHFVFNFVDSQKFRHKEVPSDLALLHHYRDWGDADGKPLNIVDRHMVRYSGLLQRAVIHTHKHVKVLTL